MKKGLLAILGLILSMSIFSPVFASESHCEEGQVQDEDGNCVYPDEGGEEEESPVFFKF